MPGALAMDLNIITPNRQSFKHWHSWAKWIDSDPKRHMNLCSPRHELVQKNGDADLSVFWLIQQALTPWCNLDSRRNPSFLAHTPLLQTVQDDGATPQQVSVISTKSMNFLSSLHFWVCRSGRMYKHKCIYIKRAGVEGSGVVKEGELYSARC